LDLAGLAEPKIVNVSFSLVSVCFSKAGGVGKLRGGTEEAPRRHQGGNAILDGPPYVVTMLVLSKNEASQDLTGR